MSAAFPSESAARPAARTRLGVAHLVRVVAVASPGVVATVALAAGAADRPMTMDESFTLLTVNGTAEAFGRSLTLDPGMAVYYAIARAWSQVLGGDLATVRLLSTIAVVLSMVGIAQLGVSRRRGHLGAAAGLALAMAPMIREAAVDARAGAFGVAAAIGLALAFDRYAGFGADLEASGRRIGGLTVASVGAAYIHPSTLFVGIAGIVYLGRRVRRTPGVERRGVVAGAVVIVLGILAAAWQSPAGAAVAEGYGGVELVLAQLPGGRWTAGLALLATAGVLFAGRAFDDERILRNFGGAALAWFALCCFALPVANLFVPRYFVAATALVTATIVVGVLERWSRPVIVLVLAIGVAGGFEQSVTDVGYGSTWCAAAEALVEPAVPGDRLVFGDGQHASAVVGCLDADTAALLTRLDIAPSAVAAGLDDARTLWTTGAPSAAEILHVEPDHRTGYVWTATDASFPSAFAELAGYGVTCSTEAFGELNVSWCAGTTQFAS